MSLLDNEKMTPVETAETELTKVGNYIRKLKADLVQSGAKDPVEADKHSKRIEEQVALLTKLKERYCNILLEEIHRLETSTEEAAQQRILVLENLLPSNEAKKLKKKRKQQAKKKQGFKERKFDVKKGVENIKCQRKIFHLLDHQGEDDTFRYFVRIHPNNSNFKEGDDVYLTEKIDGTTMQATNNGVYKRFERKQARESGTNWRKLSSEERYTLERVDLDNRSNQYVAEAVTPYLHLFQKLPDGVCMYFEAVGPRIGARFANTRLAHTVQVFDSSEKDKFVAFEKTIELCKSIGLPHVAYCRAELNLKAIVDLLSKKPRYSDFEAPLEGFVVRPVGDENSSCAKIRVDDLTSIADIKLR